MVSTSLPETEPPPEFPSLYRASDEAAITSQRNHLRLVRLRLDFLIAVAGISAISWSVISMQGLGFAITGVLLILGLGISLVQVARRYDKTWFVTRSIAESLKAQAWFYMMRVKPYDSETADASFRENVKVILGRHPSVPPAIIAKGSRGDDITESMRRLREQPIEVQAGSYVRNRLSDQRNWYSSKSLDNAKRENGWFYYSICLQLGAAVLALTIVGVMTNVALFNTTFAYFNPVGIATTAASASLAWSESKRYGELARSYSIVAAGLAELESNAKRIESQGQLRSLVSETERSISQEHEVWLTRSLRE